MSAAPAPPARQLVLAGALSLAGQATALLFMLHATPYTTLAFVGLGSVSTLLAIAVFAYATYQEIRSRGEGILARRFEAGEVIFRQGDPGDCVYVVNSGEVEVLREDSEGRATPLARLGPGEYFGEMALLSDAPRNATVRAATTVEVLSIQQEAFRSLYASVPALRTSIEEVRSKRRRDAATR